VIWKLRWSWWSPNQLQSLKLSLLLQVFHELPPLHRKFLDICCLSFGSDRCCKSLPPSSLSIHIFPLTDLQPLSPRFSVIKTPIHFLLSVECPCKHLFLVCALRYQKTLLKPRYISPVFSTIWIGVLFVQVFKDPCNNFPFTILSFFSLRSTDSKGRGNCISYLSKAIKTMFCQNKVS
jgi:hypothetical protein